MQEFGISKLEAAIYVGKMIDYYRGIANKPNTPKPPPLADGLTSCLSTLSIPGNYFSMARIF